MNMSHIKGASESLAKIKGITYDEAWAIIMEVCISYGRYVDSQIESARVRLAAQEEK